jgi:alkyl hydroperoxide reductase subunit AhpC/predicted Ser/Thr protein kinase
MPHSLTVGGLAPDFELTATTGFGREAPVRLTDYRGRWLALVFYPRDFSLVCPTELTSLSQHLPEFRERGCEILGISTDDIATHDRWISTPLSRGGLGGLDYPLAADPNGDVSRAYGVYVEWQRSSLRALFILDPNGVVQYSVIHNMSVGRRTEEVLRVVDALQTGGLCPENWTPGTPLLDPVKVLEAGHVIGHYQIEQVLGRGSFATVYRARDMVLHRPVALKVIQPEPGRDLQFILHEARAAAALNHHNVCGIFAVDDSDGVPLIVLEYVPGQSLRDLIRETGSLPRHEVVRIAREMAGGMSAAHAAGVIHGDLKPDNVLIREDGAVKITDFGLARREGHSAGTEETIVWDPEAMPTLSGTPAYMSPEQAAGHSATMASDVFAWGLIVYEMLTGQKAFDGTSLVSVLQQVATVDADQLAGRVEAPFSDLLKTVLQREPADRGCSMPELAENLVVLV